MGARRTKSRDRQDFETNVPVGCNLGLYIYILIENINMKKAKFKEKKSQNPSARQF